MCQTKFSLPHFKSRTNASWPHPLSERNLSCLSKHILLPNFLCSMALASRCVLSVLFPELAYNRNPAPPYRMQLVEKKEFPKLPLPANVSTALPTTSVTMGRIWGLEIIKITHFLVDGCGKLCCSGQSPAPNPRWGGRYLKSLHGAQKLNTGNKNCCFKVHCFGHCFYWLGYILMWHISCT